MTSDKFNTLFLSLSDRLFRLAKTMLHNDEDAADALQDIQLKMWEKRDSFSMVENIPAFLMRMMKNLCIDKLRVKHDTVDLNCEVDSENDNPYQHVELKDMVAYTRLLISRLPLLQRSVMNLRDVEGLEISEIAVIMEINENAVTVNLSRARAKIRTQLLKELQVKTSL